MAIRKKSLLSAGMIPSKQKVTAKQTSSNDNAGVVPDTAKSPLKDPSAEARIPARTWIARLTSAKLATARLTTAKLITAKKLH